MSEPEYLVSHGSAGDFGRFRTVPPFSYRRGERVVVLGGNGSGKTTVLNMLSGYLASDSGSIHFDGRRIARPDPTTMYRGGMSRTFQRARVLPEIDVLDNLLVAAPHDQSTPERGRQCPVWVSLMALRTLFSCAKKYHRRPLL